MASITPTSNIEGPVYTGLQAPCNATASTQNSCPPGVGLELSVGGIAESITDRLRALVIKAKVNHKAKILTQSDLKTACIYCKLNTDIKPQSYGTLIESYIINKYNVKKNTPSACTGDICIAGTQNYEVKVSLGGSEHNKFNFVQIRMNHVCDYLLIAYYLSATNIDTNGELFVFKLTKPEIKHLILKYGGLAHGTTTKKGVITQESIDMAQNETEYALRPKYGDACWTELVNSYRISDYEAILKCSTVEGNQVGSAN